MGTQTAQHGNLDTTTPTASPTVRSAWDVIKREILSFAACTAGAGGAVAASLVYREYENYKASILGTVAGTFIALGGIRAISNIVGTLRKIPAPEAGLK